MMPLHAMSWMGGKSVCGSGVGRWLAGLLPASDGQTIYIEPFAGMLGLLLQRPPEGVEVVNDLNGMLMNWWQQVRDNHEKLEAKLRATPYSRRLFEQVVGLLTSEEPPPPLERAWAFTVLCTQGMMPGSNKTLHGYCWSGFRSSYSNVEARLPALAARLRKVRLECRDALKVLADHADREEAIWYVDPPYEGSEPYAETVKFRALAEHLLRLRGRALVSGYDGNLPELEAAGWHRSERKAFVSTGLTYQPKPVLEVAWTNYAPPSQLGLFE